MALSECAAMLYEVSSHSSLALKVLIGTGGQQALVQLLSTALHIIRWVSQRVPTLMQFEILVSWELQLNFLDFEFVV
jgi:hypothetical protein